MVKVMNEMATQFQFYQLIENSQIIHHDDTSSAEIRTLSDIRPTTSLLFMIWTRGTRRCTPSLKTCFPN